ncbi:MAG: glycosyltransferase family 2 protein [Synechococcus sp.]
MNSLPLSLQSLLEFFSTFEHIEFLLASLSLIGLAGLSWKLFFALTSAPHLSFSWSPVTATGTTVAVIVPAFNEEANVVTCLASILDSTSLPIQVYLADDCSTDATLQLAQRFQTQRGDDRLHIIQVPSRPQNERWVGKNWACHYTTRQLEVDYFLFLDCDATLEPNAIEAAVSLIQTKQVGLLTIAPEIICGCMAEWLVQPVLMPAMAGWFSPQAVNDSACTESFAAGPFMLFDSTTYRAIGGHERVKSCVVEDLELARRIKEQQLGLHFTYSGSLVKVRMYRDFAQLWEGWTKNAFQSMDRNWWLLGFAVATLLGMYVFPWLSGVLGLLTDNHWLLGMGVAGVTFHLLLRGMLLRWANLPLKFWWLSGVGGFLTAVIFLSSAYRTITGRGWTWKGRQLQ